MKAGKIIEPLKYAKQVKKAEKQKQQRKALGAFKQKKTEDEE